MYPLTFIPILKSMIWGGDKLLQYKGIDTEQKNIGESWELSGVPEARVGNYPECLKMSLLCQTES